MTRPVREHRVGPPTATDVANELASVARGLPLADRLGELQAALRAMDTRPPEADEARRWASVDLLGSFLGEENDIPERGRVSRLLDFSVQVLVFVPIAVTWLGLFIAARAYQEADAAGALHGESFMQGWQTGFGGRVPGPFVFDKIALYTFVLVTALIVITAVRVVRDRAEAERQAALRRRLAAALVRADVLLAPYRLPAPDRAAREFEAAADKMSATATAIDTIATTAAGAQGTAAAALAAVTEAVASAERAALAAAAAASVLEAAPDRFGDHLDQLATATSLVALAERDLVDATGKASDRIAGALEDGSQQVRESIGTVGTAAASYVNRTEVAADVLGQAQQTIAGLPAVVTELRADVQSLGGDVTALAGQLANLERVTRAVAELQLSLDAMRQSLDAAIAGLGTPPPPRGLAAVLTGMFTRRGYP
jgi:hypothetical protein